MKIHLFDDDPRQITDKENYLFNHGPFATISIKLNEQLKKMGYYAEADDADWVGKCDGLDIGFKYRDKKSFLIHVYETSNTIPIPLLQNAFASKQLIFGLADQISDLWKKYGFNVKTLYPGCDTEFWYQVCPKDSEFTFLHINSSSVRSGIELSIQAYDRAFCGRKDVKLIIKDTNKSPIFQRKIQEYIDKGCNIEYISDRISDLEIRKLYSRSHVCLNVLRSTSFGFPLLECGACNCLCVTGDIPPTNEIITSPMEGLLIKSCDELKIADVVPGMIIEWGLHNSYPNWPYPEEPRFFDFNIQEYANLLRGIIDDYIIWGMIDVRKPIIEKWGWDKSAKKLIEYLSEK